MADTFWSKVGGGNAPFLEETGRIHITGYVVVRRKTDDDDEIIVDIDGDDTSDVISQTYDFLYETEEEAKAAAEQITKNEDEEGEPAKDWKKVFFVATLNYLLDIKEAKPAPKPRPGGYTISQAGAYEDRVKPTKPPEADTDPDDALSQVDLDEDVGLEMAGSVSKIDPATLVQKATAYVRREDRRWYRKRDDHPVTMVTAPTTYRRLNAVYEARFLNDTVTSEEQTHADLFELR